MAHSQPDETTERRSSEWLFCLRRRTRPRLTDENARHRRKRIIDAALHCFAEQGLHRTTMADLIEAAGTSAGSIYSWFASKDDIIEAAYRGSGRPSAKWMASTLENDSLAGIVEVLRTAALMFDDPTWQMTSRVNIQLWGETLVNQRIRDSFPGGVGVGVVGAGSLDCGGQIH